VRAEGRVSIHYGPVEGHYPDGRPWHLRAPNYAITALRAGPLASGTIVRPRLAPALFGLGLLEAVPAEEIARPNTADPGEPAWRVRAGHRQIGRFGWQAITVSIREQTTRAFAREMGITSSDVPIDDCTPSEVDCLAQPNGGTPEVSPELLDALLAFQRWLAVPESPVHETYPEAERTFLQLGCASCHRPVLHPTLADASGHPVTVRIAPYTDLKVHDLGPELADRTVSGEIVRSRWRTAPLWGLGYRISREHFPTFLHDGRARSAEEAILWHKGEGSVAREAFENLPVEQRDRLLHWLETL
jgi:CxxC motif-containing protein (DUF1111 family)